MPKSKYPQNLDTSVQLPAVRDSVLSDPINSLRSAVIQIERTLGVNPQGTSGNTVASRLNKVLDGNGNLLPEAFVQAGLISGPITNNDVSDVAAITEKKLNLNFPTQLLQDEISMLQADLDSISSQIASLSVKLATHLSVDALNRHPGTSISLTEKTATASDLGTLNLESSEVQDAFDVLYNKHINYTGANIASNNNSHLANQIYFDNSNVSAVISDQNVQDAIEAISGSGVTEKNIHQDIQHSNGILRVGKLETPSDDELSEILASNVSVSFSASDGSSTGTFIITLLENVDLTDYSLKPFDFVKIEDSTDTDQLFTGIYEIKGYSVTGSNLDTIEVFGFAGDNSTASTTITIGKNIERRTNEAGLLLGATEEATLTSTRFLRLSNPDSTRVISQNINPMGITSSNRYVNIAIDSDTYTIDLYDTTVVRQSIDSILVKINEKLAEEAANAMAYRIDFEKGNTEIAIIHNIPDDSLETHTITISRSSDDGIDELGFGYIEDVSVSNLYGTKYFLNGETYSGLKEKVDSTELVFFSGSNQIGKGNSSIDFIQAGVRVGDIVIITGANNNNDDGSYIISQVESAQITVNSGQLPSGFTDVSLIDSTRIRIYSNSISVQDITFDKVSSSLGSSLIELFMDRNRDLYFSKLLEYNSVVVGSESLIDIVDIEGDNFYNEIITINANENIDDPDAFYIDIDGGSPLNIIGERKYVWITSHDKNIRLKVFIPDASTIASKIATDGIGFSISVYLFERTNAETNLLLGIAGYNNFNGRFCGGIYGPRVISKLPIGTLGSKDFASTAKSEIIEKPLSELRYNGVIYGFEIENISIDSNNFYNFDVRRGLAYINGKRIERDTVTSIVTDIDSSSIDKIYLTIDDNGSYNVESAIPGSCITPFGESDFAILGSVEYDGANLEYIDLRLFIDHLDLKLLNSITVSPQKGMGHFDDLVKALKYTKRFKEQFPNANTPILHLKSGTHTIELDYNYGENSVSWDPDSSANRQIFYDQQIESGFWIDFPVTIEGEGQGTIIDLVNTSTFTDTSYELTMPIIIAGDGFSEATRGFDTLSNGGFVTIRDLRLRNTRISILDFNIKKTGADVRSGVKIENVIFNYQNFAGNFIDGTNGPRAIELLEISDTSTNKGNLTVEGCTFIKCGIHVDEVTRTKNLTIINNSIIDDDDSSNFLFQDLFSFATAVTGSNITITGNRYTGNLNPNGSGGPEMVAGSSLAWGDRFDRDIRVGGTGRFDDTIEVETQTISTSYAYPTTKTKEFIFTWFNSSIATAGPTSVSTTIGTLATSSGVWVVAEINSGDEAYMHVVLPSGLYIDSVELGVQEQGAGGFDWTLGIYKYNFDGSADELVYGLTTETSSDTGTPSQVTFSNVGVTTESDAVYNFSISHDQGFTNRSIYVKVITTFTEIEDVLGV